MKREVIEKRSKPTLTGASGWSNDLKYLINSVMPLREGKEGENPENTDLNLLSTLEPTISN